jgi:hypothetical protein
MAFYRKQGGGNVAPSVVRRRSAGSWVDVQTIRRREGGSWVTVWNSYVAVSLSLQAYVDGYGRAGKPIYDEQANATATASGGRAPLTFSWTKVSGSSVIRNTTPSSATAIFKCSSGPTSMAFTETAVWRCTVSDGITAASKDTTVTFTFDGM